MTNTNIMGKKFLPGKSVLCFSYNQTLLWTLQLKSAAKMLNELVFFTTSFEGPQKLYSFYNETWIVLFLPLDSVLPSLFWQVKK